MGSHLTYAAYFPFPLGECLGHVELYVHARAIWGLQLCIKREVEEERPSININEMDCTGDDDDDGDGDADDNQDRKGIRTRTLHASKVSSGTTAAAQWLYHKQISSTLFAGRNYSTNIHLRASYLSATPAWTNVFFSLIASSGTQGERQVFHQIDLSSDPQIKLSAQIIRPNELWNTPLGKSDWLLTRYCKAGNCIIYPPRCAHNLCHN